MSDEPDDRPALIEAQVDAIREKLAKSAAAMSARYNGTVYLVGSVLHSPTPRDVDVRIVVADHEFGVRFGMEMKPCDEPPTETRMGRTAKIFWDADDYPQRWIDDTAKTGAAWSRCIGHNVDLKVWPESYWREPYPKPVILAAPSPRWAIYNRYFPDPTSRPTPEKP